MSTEYVDAASGTDTGSSSSQSWPWKTLQYAHDWTGAGDEIYCYGTFTEQINLSAQTSLPSRMWYGCNSSWVKGAADATIDGESTRASGLELSPSAATTYNMFQHFEFKNHTSYPTYAGSAAQGITLKDCLFENNAYGPFMSSRSTIIRGTLVDATGGSPQAFQSGGRTTFVACVIQDAGSHDEGFEIGYYGCVVYCIGYNLNSDANGCGLRADSSGGFAGWNTVDGDGGLNRGLYGNAPRGHIWLNNAFYDFDDGLDLQDYWGNCTVCNGFFSLAGDQYTGPGDDRLALIYGDVLDSGDPFNNSGSRLYQPSGSSSMLVGGGFDMTRLWCDENGGKNNSTIGAIAFVGTPQAWESALLTQDFKGTERGAGRGQDRGSG